MCLYQQRFIKEPGKVHIAPATGATRAYLQLAYDLYALDHNAEIQDVLLNRIRSHDQFSGALYEVQVAATLIRAGFSLAFEDETDRSSSHCEFTATHNRTERSFSVEAKKREGTRPRIVRLFHDALSKRANHDRVIFIDFNMPFIPLGDLSKPENFPPFLIRAQKRLRQLELEPTSSTKPPAYVFVTNFPAPHHLDSETPPGTAVIEGFKIPDFKAGIKVTLREAIHAREKHTEMHELMRSMQDHSDIPATFDGDNPELAFSGVTNRITIGKRIMLSGQGGAQIPVKITTAVVMEQAKVALCGGQLDNGEHGLFQVPLSDEEIAAWRRHPDTFFGAVTDRPTKGISHPLDMYDFFHKSCKAAAREDLLNAVAGAFNFEHLKTLSQPDLASIRAEQLALGTMQLGAARATSKQ
jgi:hypothetical protein